MMISSPSAVCRVIDFLPSGLTLTMVSFRHAGLKYIGTTSVVTLSNVRQLALDADLEADQLVEQLERRGDNAVIMTCRSNPSLRTRAS